MSSAITRYIHDHEPQTGSFNMTADDVLARGLSSSGCNSILRIYSFNPPAVSLGRNQSESEVNMLACQLKEWDVIRRSTGGRSLLHLNDICYSIIVPINFNVFKDLRRLYEGIALSLASALVKLGIKASPIDIPIKPPFNKQIKNARLCISARVRGEVHVKGRKITAASQRIYRDSILQHGSIFYGGDPSIVADIVPSKLFDGNDFVAKLKERVITIEEAQPHPIPAKLFINVFISQLCHHFSFNLDDKPLTSNELEEIAALESNFALLSFEHEYSAG